ncbi:rhophilin-2-A-like isoform X2 [Tigriopus californicus]|uniref:rhophilin-2-A-like isoform X2 n=1 Tax=Tigriopus californicus TaxID=6832 RepID=UPI0027DA3197|nr:rhophilin-2-A-like isoform X2 [Tigriopus californicus]
MPSMGKMLVHQEALNSAYRKGSDPRAATCRGKLQSKRSKLNMEINKELMLRSGAENLFKATTNKKLKETVALELSFVNSNLQLLKEQLAELNSSVELYQNAAKDAEIPMIPLGLKETKEIDFREPFKDFILEHYSEDGHEYENAIAEFMDVRQAMRTPTRDQNGIALLFEHFNQLYYVERRFFPPDRSLGIFFEWYDSLTGVPSCQRTVAFEKASVLFNIAALYTQIGTRQDRFSQTGLDLAVDNFLRAAGTFQYIHENFTNAPSMDLSPDTLELMVHLMCAQARECLFEKAELTLKAKGVNDIETCIILGQEAAHVSEVYCKVHGIIANPPVKDYVPYSWISLTQVKREHYKALAHYFVAVGLLDHKEDEFSQRATELLQFLHDESDDENDKALGCIEIRVPKTTDEKRYLGKAHLREALLLHEEAMRVNRMCRELRKKGVLQNLLRNTHDRSLNKYASIDEEDDFQEVLDPPPVVPSTQYQLSLAFPDLSQHKVQDLFADLGPVAIFNAKHYWSAPRSIKLRKRDHEGYGFSVRGDSPVIIAGVDHRSLAETGGMKDGDYIVGINEHDVKWSPHDEVVSLIKSSGNSLKLKVVTPMDGKSQVPPPSTSSSKMIPATAPSHSSRTRGSISPTSTSSGVSGMGTYSSSHGGDSSSPASSVTSGSTRSTGTGLSKEKKPWNIFSHGGKKSVVPHHGDLVREKTKMRDDFDDNVILR